MSDIASTAPLPPAPSPEAPRVTPTVSRGNRSKSWEDVLEESGTVESAPSLPAHGNLVRLADQLHALASELENATPSSTLPHLEPRIRTGSARQFGADYASTDIHSERVSFLAIARARYEARRKRVAVFDRQELFGEPAWDILLDLYIAHAEGKPVSVSSACIGSASPPTTGLRWLGVLQDAGLVEREHDLRDQRRVLVRLSEDGIERMEDYFRSALSLDVPGTQSRTLGI